MKPILGMTLRELSEELASIGEHPFRARQIFRWVYQDLVTEFDAMTNLPQALRRRLAELFELETVHALHVQRADDGLTEKALFELAVPSERLLKGPLAERRRRFNSVETVLMEYPGIRTRRTICVSSQAGCAMACEFCATGQSGFVRDLSAGEILGQVLHFARQVRDRQGDSARITNLVFMGQGEPFANFDDVWRAVELLHAPEAFGLGARHITLSTVGVVPRILELAHKRLQVNLAVSLHAANDAKRSQLVPLNRRYPIAQLMDAVREYTRLTNRRVSFEWACMRDVNDTIADARELADLVRGMLCHVNLIPFNDVPGSPFGAPAPGRVEAMAATLNARGIPTTIRDTRGRQIDAACGQLRARVLEKTA